MNSRPSFFERGDVMGVVYGCCYTAALCAMIMYSVAGYRYKSRCDLSLVVPAVYGYGRKNSECTDGTNLNILLTDTRTEANTSSTFTNRYTYI